MALINKKYGSKIILSNIEFTPQIGKITGIVGRNGCGKTTLLKSLIGLINGSSGVLKNISYLSDRSEFMSLDFEQLISFYEGIYSDFSREKMLNLMTLVNLNIVNINELSYGERRKLKLLFVLSRNVDFYILDEPFSEIDVFSIDEVISLILNAVDFEKSGLIVTDHNIDILERLVDDVLFLKDGIGYFYSNIDQNSSKKLLNIYKEIEGLI